MLKIRRYYEEGFLLHTVSSVPHKRSTQQRPINVIPVDSSRFSRDERVGGIVAGGQAAADPGRQAGNGDHQDQSKQQPTEVNEPS